MRMIRSLFIAITSLTLLAWTPPPSTVQLTLEWDYPTNEVASIEMFRVYSSTNIAIPLSSWTVLASIGGTNSIVSTNGTNAICRLPFTIVPAQRFFSVTASNVWFESDFSDVLSTPHLPRRDIKLKLVR